MQHQIKNVFFLLLFYCIYSCSAQQPDNDKSTMDQQKVDTVAIFVDSTNIAIPNMNKVIAVTATIDDSISKTLISFFAKENNAWRLQYSFNDDHWHPSDILITGVEDYNNDGYKDFIYSKGTGARGGNSIQNLFIYDKKDNSLTYVLNSNDYPNLHYNKETNSINAYILTGGNETLFMRLSDNKLVPFASIDQYGKMITVTEYDNQGRSKVIFSDSSGKYEEFADFINFKPLRAKE